GAEPVRGTRARRRRKRLVQPSGRRRVPRQRRSLGRRLVHLRRVLGSRQRLGLGRRNVPGQGGEHRFRVLRAPLRRDAAVNALDRAVTITWSASADAAAITIVRTGGGSAAPVTVYEGKRVTTFTDKAVRNGRRYTYVVTALDEAGNKRLARGTATPSAPLLAPRAAAHVR